jgi:hypothetical protein
VGAGKDTFSVHAGGDRWTTQSSPPSRNVCRFVTAFCCIPFPDPTTPTMGIANVSTRTSSRAASTDLARLVSRRLESGIEKHLRYKDQSLTRYLNTSDSPVMPGMTIPFFVLFFAKLCQLFCFAPCSFAFAACVSAFFSFFLFFLSFSRSSSLSWIARFFDSVIGLMSPCATISVDS